MMFARMLRIILLPGVLCVFSQSALADSAAFRDQAVAVLEGSGSVEVAGTTIYGADRIRQMYQALGYTPIWSEAAIADLGVALDGVERDGLTPDDYRFAAIDAQLRSPDLSGLSTEAAVSLDILLSEAFLRAAHNLYFGKADPRSIDPDINFVRAKAGDEATQILLEYVTAAQIDAALDWARPDSRHYDALVAGLATYRAYQAAGGWDAIPAGPTLKPGTSDDRVIAVRRRLAVTGDLPVAAGAAAASTEFDEALAEGVKVFQTRHGLEVDGAIGPATLAAMNMPVEARIDQIRVNLDRDRWILHEAHDEYLVADIAGFEVYWAEGEDIVWSEQIQVGKEYTKTPVFGGKIQYLEFNPTWTIPPGILRRSVIPGLKKDPGYLDARGYQLLTQDGKRVDPLSVDWNNLKGFPYIVRQPAGPDNALGQVKFIFPNPHFVFLHDTNHREFFGRSKRAFSSGCIRVRNPFDLAERLLARQGWDRARIDGVIASGKTTRVSLEEPMRVFIAYNTARVPDNVGPVHFRTDVYDRDPGVLAALDDSFRLQPQAASGG